MEEEDMTVFSDLIETTEGWTFLATSTKARLRSLTVSMGPEDFSAATHPQAGIIPTRMARKIE